MRKGDYQTPERCCKKDTMEKVVDWRDSKHEGNTGISVTAEEGRYREWLGNEGDSMRGQEERPQCITEKENKFNAHAIALLGVRGWGCNDLIYCTFALHFHPDLVEWYTRRPWVAAGSRPNIQRNPMCYTLTPPHSVVNIRNSQLQFHLLPISTKPQ